MVNIYLHLGKGHMLPYNKVIFVGKIDVRFHSHINKDFIERKRKEGLVVDASDGNPQSFVVTEDKTYFSLISSKTLEKRLRKPVFLGGSNG